MDRDRHICRQLVRVRRVLTPQGFCRAIRRCLALGGSSADVLRLVVGQGMAVVASGIVVGLLTALVLTRLMSTLLFGVRAADAFTFVAVSMLLLAVALVACFVPAIRATGLQPAAVLRNE